LAHPGGLDGVLDAIASVISSLSHLGESLKAIPRGMREVDGEIVNRGGHAPTGLNRKYAGATPSSGGPRAPTPEPATSTSSPEPAVVSGEAILPPLSGAFFGSGTAAAAAALTVGTAATGASPARSARTGELTATPVPIAGTDAGVVDFGAITINGVTTYLGAVQGPYVSTRDAADYVVAAINVNAKNGVQASLDDQGRLVLTSESGAPITIDRAGISTTGDPEQLVNLGLEAGTYGTTMTADRAIASGLFEDVFQTAEFI
jgi:hypothetical protein